MNYSHQHLKKVLFYVSKTKTILLAVLSTLYTVLSFAQNPNLDLSALVNDPGPNPDANYTALAHLSGSAEYVNTDQAALDTMPAMLRLMEEKSITLNVVMGNTNGTSKIAISIGSSEGSNDVFYKEFTYGSQGNFNDGTSYHAQGNTIAIGLGRFAGAAAYYAEVFALRSDGTKSAVKRITIE